MSALSFAVRTVLHPGNVTGPVLKLSEPLSFWGGFDPTDGRILDQAHPQVGQTITDCILTMPGSRGSAGTPAGIAEALRRKVGPAAILLLKPDVNITIGAQVAQRLYSVQTPVATIDVSDFDTLETGMIVTVGCNDADQATPIEKRTCTIVQHSNSNLE